MNIKQNIIFRHTEYWRFQIQSIRSQTEMEKKLHLQEMEVLNAMQFTLPHKTMVNFQSSRKKAQQYENDWNQIKQEAY